MFSWNVLFQNIPISTLTLWNVSRFEHLLSHTPKNENSIVWFQVVLWTCETHQSLKANNGHDNKEPQNNMERENNSSKTKKYFLHQGKPKYPADPPRV